MQDFLRLQCGPMYSALPKVLQFDPDDNLLGDDPTKFFCLSI